MISQPMAWTDWASLSPRGLPAMTMASAAITPITPTALSTPNRKDRSW